MPEVRWGWTASPNTRGTLDIIWSCLVTVFLCTWTVLCLNVPEVRERRIHAFWRKFRWTFIAIFGPEFLLCFVIGQWASARRSVAAFREARYQGWSMAHAFYADMGGFMLHPRDSKPFPVSAKQVLYLVRKGHIPFPEIERREIKGKSKSDGFSRAITLVQTGWFLLQCLGRAITRQPMSTLELSTAAFVLCTIPTYALWYEKPQDVETPTIITSENSTAEMLIAAGPLASKPFQQTPLDFVDDLKPTWSLTVMPALGFRAGPEARPFPRLPNDRLPEIGVSVQVCLCFMTMIYASTHMVGWNFSFASHLEKILWRVACLIHLTTTASFWIVDTPQRVYTAKYLAPPGDALAEVLGIRKASVSNGIKNVNSVLVMPVLTHRLSHAWTGKTSTTEEISMVSSTPVHTLTQVFSDPVDPPSGESSYSVPMWQVFLTTVMTLVYAVARMYLVIEVFIGLRSLPEGAYDTVNWTSVFPHI